MSGIRAAATGKAWTRWRKDVVKAGLRPQAATSTVIALTDYGTFGRATEKGFNPSYATVAKGLGITPLTVKRHVKIARDAGWVVTYGKTAPGHPQKVSIAFPELLAAARSDLLDPEQGSERRSFSEATGISGDPERGSSESATGISTAPPNSRSLLRSEQSSNSRWTERAVTPWTTSSFVTPNQGDGNGFPFVVSNRQDRETAAPAGVRSPDGYESTAGPNQTLAIGVDGTDGTREGTASLGFDGEGISYLPNQCVHGKRQWKPDLEAFVCAHGCALLWLDENPGPVPAVSVQPRGSN